MGPAASVIFTIDQAICFINNKKEKGKLTIYNDGYYFSGKNSLSGKFDICGVKVSKTILSIRGLFGEKHIPALLISCPEKDARVFEFDDKLIGQAIESINDYAQKEKQRRTEEQYSSACQKMSEIRSSSQAADVGRVFEMLSTYKDSKKRAQECSLIERDYEKKEKTYAEAMKLCESNEIGDLNSAIQLFEIIPDYLDVPERLKTVQRKHSDITKKTYTKACELLSKAQIVDPVNHALVLFRSISGYKDANQKIRECNKLKQDLEKKESIFIRAEKLLNNASTTEQVDEASQLFLSIDGYRTAHEQINECIKKRNAIQKTIYDKALHKLSCAKVSSDVDESIKLLKSIEEYADSKKQIEKCLEIKQTLEERERKESIFVRAEELLNNASTTEQVDEASQLFLSIDGYRTAHEQIKECIKKKNAIQKTIYDKALQKLTCAKVPSDADEAIKLLKSIEEYTDSKKQIEKCLEIKQTLEQKEAIYKKAKDDYIAAKTIDEHKAVIKVLTPIADYRDANSVIRRCNEHIKKIREEEERARKEAEERARIEAEKKAALAAIEKEKCAPDDLSVTDSKIISANRKALNLFLDNPFRVLGLSRNAAQEDALEVMDKFKKLERLKALGSYIAPYHLKHFKRPDRSLAVIQAAIGTLNSIENRILWFSTTVGCAAWACDEYRHQTEKLPGIDYDEYDNFLANYLFAVLNDPKFENRAMWDAIFRKMAAYIKESKATKQFFADVKGSRMEDDSAFAKMFEKKISQPICFMIEDADISALEKLYVRINNKKDLATISKKLDGRFSNWFETETRIIDKEIRELGEGENATSASTSKAMDLYAKLHATVWPHLVWAEANYPEKSVRLTMFQDEYRGTAWGLMVFLFKAGSKAIARLIADDIEKYCTDEQKEILKYVIREVPRPRPKPVPPEHEHYDLGFVFIGYDELKIVEVTLNFSANVYLMEDSDFDDYMNCRNFSYYGGRATKSPYRIKIPSFGHWHLVIDDGPGGLGGVSSSAKIRTIPNSYY